MTLQLEETSPEGTAPRPGPPAGYNTMLLAAIAAVVVVLIAVIALVVAAGSGDGDDVDAGGGTSSTAEPEPETPSSTATTSPSPTSSAAPSSATSASTSSSSTATSTPSSTASTAGPSTSSPSSGGAGAVWPAPGSSGFASPEEAARRFAVDLAGFRDPLLGDFQAGDARSGEIGIRPSSSGPTTTVLVRQLTGDGSWWVIGAISDDIVVDRPRVGDPVAGSLQVVGRARAFEGVVELALYRHGVAEPIVSGFVTGRGDGTLGEFDEQFDVPAGSQGPGVLVLTSSNGDDGTALTVAAVPVEVG